MSDVPTFYQRAMQAADKLGEIRSAELRDSDVKNKAFTLPYEPRAISPWRPATEQGGVKYDQGKPPISLVDSEWVEGVAKVLGFGANKYDKHNWRGGISFSRLLDACLRHVAAINRGEDIDPESNLPHVFHASCCLMFLSWMMNHRKDLDDRFKY